MLGALAASLAKLGVTTGTSAPTCTGASPTMPSVATAAVKLPRPVGFVRGGHRQRRRSSRVRHVADAPLLKLTVFLLATLLNPKPLMTTLTALAGRLDVLERHSESPATCTVGRCRDAIVDDGSQDACKCGLFDEGHRERRGSRARHASDGAVVE